MSLASSNCTLDAQCSGEPQSSGALVAVLVLVPLCVLITVGVVLYLCYRRRQCRCDKPKPSVTSVTSVTKHTEIVHMSVHEDAPVVVIGNRSRTSTTSSAEPRKSGDQDRFHHPIIRTDSKLVQNIASQRPFIARERKASHGPASRVSGRSFKASRSAESVGVNGLDDTDGAKQRTISFNAPKLGELSATQSVSGLDSKPEQTDTVPQVPEPLIRSASRENLYTRFDNEGVVDSRSRVSSASSLAPKTPNTELPSQTYLASRDASESHDEFVSLSDSHSRLSAAETVPLVPNAAGQSAASLSA